MSLRLFAALIIVLPALAGSLPDRALAKSIPNPPHLSLRLGAVREGTQHTLIGGAEVGVAIDRRPTTHFEYGIGADYASDPGHSGPFRVTALGVDFHARALFLRGNVRPYLDAGVGVCRLKVTNSGLLGSPSSTTAAEFPLGAGLGFALSPNAGLRLGVVYHPIAAEFSLWNGGDLADYVSFGIALSVSL